MVFSTVALVCMVLCQQCLFVYVVLPPPSNLSLCVVYKYILIYSFMVNFVTTIN